MSLRARLVLGMAVVALVLAGTSVFITRTTQHHLVAQLDDQLQGTSDRPGGPGCGGSDNGPPRFTSTYSALVLADGSVLCESKPNLTSDDAPAPTLSTTLLADVAGSGQGRVTTVGADGSDLRYRVVLRPAQIQGSNGFIVVGLPMNDVDNAVDRLIKVEVAATFAILALLALVTFWVLRLGVRPIKAMTATASAIAVGELSHRVDEGTPGTEAGDLGVALNQMLGRIEEAFDERTRSEQRLRRFVGDASHELRTPVTTVRGYAELYRAGGLTDEAELAEAMRRTEQESIRMGRLIDDLLLLARLDQGRPLESVPVDLSVLATEAVQDARVVHPDRVIGADVDGPVWVQGDDGRLRQVVANLVSNAIGHTQPESTVQVRARREGDRAVIEVHDDGPGMAPDVADKVFERFYRADASRSRHKGGSGLGLSIVQAITTAHGGGVSLRSAPGRGTAVRVDLPSAGSAG